MEVALDGKVAVVTGATGGIGRAMRRNAGGRRPSGSFPVLGRRFIHHRRDRGGGWRIPAPQRAGRDRWLQVLVAPRGL